MVRDAGVSGTTKGHERGARVDGETQQHREDDGRNMSVAPADPAGERGSAVQTNAPLEISGLLPKGARGSLLDLAEWGLRVVLPGPPEAELCDVVPFRIHRGDKILIAGTGRLLGLVELDLGCEVTLWIVDRDNSPWRQLVRRIGSFKTILPHDKSPLPSSRLTSDRIGPRLKSLTSLNARAQVRMLDQPDCPPIAGRLDSERGLLIEWSPAWAKLAPPYEIQVEGPFSTLRFVQSSLSWDGLPRPTDVRVFRRRQLRRVAVPSGARVILHGVGGKAEALELAMQDVSFGGVGVLLDQPAPEIVPGAEVPDVIITWRGGPGLRFSGQVRHRSPTTTPGVDTIGIQLAMARDPQHERWAREVETLLYPTTRSHDHDFERIWSLFEESGYFDLSENKRQTSDFQALRSSFENAYARMSNNPALGCLAYFDSATRVEATMTGLRMWSRSWLGMHLSRNPMRPHLANSDSVPLRDIHYHIFERAGANPDLDWTLIFVRDDAPRLSKALYRDLFLSTPGACGVPFEAWKFNVYMRGELEAPDVYVANDDQIQEVLRRLVDIRPMPYLEAHDLLPETYYQEELREEFEFYGLLRERTMLIAVEGETIVAAAVLEAVEDGLHLYGLLDSARLFEIEPGGNTMFGPILIATNEWFFTMGKSGFVCFDENGNGAIMRSAGGLSIGKAVTTHLPRHATPELLERISELSAPK